MILRRSLLLASTLTLLWHAPLLTEGGHVPADCVECAVLYYAQKTGVTWWKMPTLADTLAFVAVIDGQACSYVVPLWVGYGSTNIVCRDAAYNWSLPSNYWESKQGIP